MPERKWLLDAGDPDAGQAVANFVKNNLHNLVNQFSSERQAKRIKDVSQYALNGIKYRLENGEKLRDDNFFEQIIDRSYAEEALESVLLKARDEPQEKKIPYLGKLFENGCFDSNLESDLLHFLCQEAENLTYRQLCIIKVVNEMNEKKYRLRNISVRGHNENKKPGDVRYTLPAEKISVLNECVALCNKEYIAARISYVGNDPTETWYTIVPSTMQPSLIGKMMYKHMNLKSIQEEDIFPIVNALSY